MQHTFHTYSWTIALAPKDKRSKFVSLAEKRVNRAINDIRLIGNLSNRSNYQYASEDVSKILRVLRLELEELKARFESRNTGGSSFKL